MLKKKTLADIDFTDEQVALLLENSADDLVGTEEFKGIPRRLLREKRTLLLDEFSQGTTSYKESGNVATVSGKFTGRIVTLEQLLSKCEVNTNVWEVDHHIVNKYEIARKDIQTNMSYRAGIKDKYGSETTIKEGTYTDSGEMNPQELIQVKAWLKRKYPAGFNAKRFRAELMADAAKYNTVQVQGKLFNVQTISRVNPLNNMLMINIFDMHFDKLTWHQETGYDWDSKIGTEYFKEALNSLLSQAQQFDITEIWFPVGNDFFNSDRAYPYSQTTKGTPQQSDNRWQRVFRDGRILLSDSILSLTTAAPIVKVPVVPGNHDFEKLFYLGDALECCFLDRKDVEVLNIDDKYQWQRKYMTFGDNLVGFTHGKEEKANELHNIMSVESPDWSSHPFRYMYLGHFHHERKIKYISTQEFKGLHIEYLPTLTAPDDWHHQKGFVGVKRGAKAFIHNAEKGRIATFDFWL